MFFKKVKDGGPFSPVDAYFLFEIKGLFSIALLKFNKGTREEYHTHAFDAWTWFLKGRLTEERLIEGPDLTYHKYSRSIRPKFTPKDNNHRVFAFEDSWCFTIRGPWQRTWTETDIHRGFKTTFGHGRKILAVEKFNG